MKDSKKDIYEERNLEKKKKKEKWEQDDKREEK